MQTNMIWNFPQNKKSWEQKSKIFPKFKNLIGSKTLLFLLSANVLDMDGIQDRLNHVCGQLREALQKIEELNKRVADAEERAEKAEAELAKLK